MKITYYGIVCFLLFKSLVCVAQTSQNDFSFPQSNTTGMKSISIWATQYYIHQMKSEGKIPFVLADGKPSKLYGDTCSFCAAALEGTVYIEDSTGKKTVLNYAKSSKMEFVDCRKCKNYKKSTKAKSWGKALWTVATGYGLGVLNYRLVPFRTIAVDSNVIKYGTVIFIPSIKGQKIQLPNGVVVEHDGYFFAGDRGGDIIGNHVDVFTGIYQKNPFPGEIQSIKEKVFNAYVVTDQDIISKLKRTHIQPAKL